MTSRREHSHLERRPAWLRLLSGTDLARARPLPAHARTRAHARTGITARAHARTGIEAAAARSPLAGSGGARAPLHVRARARAPRRRNASANGFHRRHSLTVKAADLRPEVRTRARARHFLAHAHRRGARAKPARAAGRARGCRACGRRACDCRTRAPSNFGARNFRIRRTRAGGARAFSARVAARTRGERTRAGGRACVFRRACAWRTWVARMARARPGARVRLPARVRWALVGRVNGARAPRARPEDARAPAGEFGGGARRPHARIWRSPRAKSVPLRGKAFHKNHHPRGPGKRHLTLNARPVGKCTPEEPSPTHFPPPEMSISKGLDLARSGELEGV